MNTLGISLLLLSQNKGASMYRPSYPERFITVEDEVLTVYDRGVKSSYLATEEDEGARDWIVS